MRGRRIDFADILLWLVPVLTIFPLRNNDLWWQLASGRFMLRHLRVPRGDPFSHTAFMGQWIDNEWLAQILIYGAWLIGDNFALILLRVLLFLVLLLLVRTLMRRLRRPGLFFPAAVVGVALSYGWWALRPSVFSLIGLVCLLLLLERVRRTGRGIFLLPVLFLCWANLHPGFLFGLLVVGGTVAALLLERVLPGWRPWTAVPRVASRLLVGWLAAIAATLVNPYGWQVYSQQLVIARGAAYRSLLDEWAPPATPFLVLVLCAVAAFLALRFRRVPLASLVPILGTAALSMTAVRFEEYFALVTVPLLMAHLGRGRVFLIALLVAGLAVGLLVPMATVLAEGSGLAGSAGAAEERVHHRMQRNVGLMAALLLTGLVAALLQRKARFTWLSRRWRGSCPATVLLPAGLIAAALVLALSTRVGLRPPAQVEPDRYPTRCLGSLPADGGRLFNRLSWGGWLIWKAEAATFIDGRCWGQEIFFEYDRCRRPGWAEIFDRRGIDWAIVAPTDAIAPLLLRSREWEPVCEDGASVLFGRVR